MEKNYNRNYRQYSYSETNLKDIKIANKDILANKDNLTNKDNLAKNDILTNNDILANNDILVNNDILTNNDIYSDIILEQYKEPKKLKCKISGYYIFKRLTMFIMHLSLISLFEIIFFFTIVVTFENNSFTGLIDNLAGPLVDICKKLNPVEKEIVTYIINSYVNITQINSNADTSQQLRITNNNIILGYAWTYFGIITGISLLFSILSLCNLSFLTKEIVINETNEPLILMNNIKIYKKHINIIKIIIDNIIMIILLGLYEYLFFKTVILKYLPISNNELIKYLFNKFEQCFIKI